MKATVENQSLITANIISLSGEVNKDKINLLAGAHTPPFVEMLWTVTGGDTDTTDRVYTLLTGLYQEGRETEMLEVLHVLYDVLGLAFPDDVELLAGHPEARSYFLFSFLLDYDDVLQDFMAEQGDGH